MHLHLRMALQLNGMYSKVPITKAIKLIQYLSANIVFSKIPIIEFNSK